MGKTLSQLTEGLNIIKRTGEDVTVTGIQFDSRKVESGDLFFCISGFKTDGHVYAAKAVENGAAALVVTVELKLDVPQIIVEDDRLAMALISVRFYDFPARRMKMIGVTGTNGKTTITYMVKSMLEACGKKVGLVGTIHNMIGSAAIDTARTTPEAPDLNKLLAQMADAGCEYLVIEVSSHSLDLKRVAGIVFDIGIFTNLTQDHLDFHETIEAYAQAKAKLFRKSRVSIINTDDAMHRVMLEANKGRLLTYGIESNAYFKAKEISVAPSGIGFDYYKGGEKIRRIEMALTGYFNAYNALAAIAAADALEMPFDQAVKGLETMEAVDGRCQVLDSGKKGFSIILDYAHTRRTAWKIPLRRSDALSPDASSRCSDAAATGIRVSVRLWVRYPADCRISAW